MPHAKELEEQKEVEDWPGLNCFPDEGSDGKSFGFGVASPVYRVNLDVRFDACHGMWNNIRNSIKGVGEWGWVL